MTDYKTISIIMEMEAGSGEFAKWPGGGKTYHAGIGYIKPFGKASYYAGIDYPEEKSYPRPDYFNQTWMNLYKTKYLCIYMLPDGDIFAYDGIVGNYEPFAPGTSEKMDELINVIVGGTGAYDGANGILLGHTQGRGPATEVDNGITLPRSLLKIMQGYINIPIKE